MSDDPQTGFIQKLTKVEPHELKDLRVVMTLVGGDVVYERSE